MKKILIACILLVCILFTACGAPAVKENSADTKEAAFTYEFADAKKGTELLMSNTEYYNNMTKADLEYRMQKKDATLEEYIELVEKQVLEFTKEEKELIDTAMKRIEDILVREGYTLPETDTINFVKTTMKEEGDVAAYTHKNDIYFGEDMLNYYLTTPEHAETYFPALILHELFHCITRNNPDFRRDMYEIINFTIAEKDFEILPEVRERMISNPDVGNCDAYATFTINGEKKDCYVLYLTTKDFEKEGERFLDNAATYIVPIDSPDTLYTIEEVEDFWTVFGDNTSYVIAPEECLADNFYCAILFEEKEYKDVEWPNPEILEKIQNLLKKK